MRGHLYALHASNGTVAWSFAGTAGPGQPGHGSWKGTSWMLGGGDVWMAPTVDAQLGMIYVAVANPQPRVSGAARAGDDLYTNSLVALNAATGKLDWYFQSVRHDLWDYDDTMTPLIAGVRYPGGTQQVVIYGSKTGWLYYLNAKTGKPALPVRQTKVPQLASQATSPTQPIPAGQSLVPTCPQRTGPTQPIPDYHSGCEFTPYLNTPVLVTPGRRRRRELGADVPGPENRAALRARGRGRLRLQQRAALRPAHLLRAPRRVPRRRPRRRQSAHQQDRLAGDNPLRAVERRRHLDHVGRLAVRGRAQRHLLRPQSGQRQAAVELADRHRDRDHAGHLHGGRRPVRGDLGRRQQQLQLHR